MTKKTPKAKAAGKVPLTLKVEARIEGTPMEVKLADLSPSPYQTRNFDTPEETRELQELAQSIATNHILQRPMIRKATGKVKTKYELIFGERRFRAARLAGLTTLPVVLVEMEDSKVRQAQSIENLQRSDLHPLDEALALQNMIESTKPPMELRECGRRVGKDEKTIARRLQLLGMIEPARQDFRAGRITAGHAMAIGLLAKDSQQSALDNCYERIYDHKLDRWVPNKDIEAKPVHELQDWIDEHLLLDLTKVPWSLEDATLVPEQGPCSTCQFNTAANMTLFGDAATAATCTNLVGYRRKLKAHIARQVERLTAGGKPLFYIAELYSVGVNEQKRYELPDGTLGRERYSLIENKKEKCDHEQGAIYVQGPLAGRVAMICIEPTCKQHAGRYSSNTREKGVAKTPAELRAFHERKQEIFNIKVADQTRLRVFKESLATFKSLDNGWLEKVAAEFYVRIPNDDAVVIQNILGRTDLPTDPRQITKLLGTLQAMKPIQLVQFLALCAFGHYGANHFAGHWKDQSQVHGLAKERGINYQLIDAQVRAELAPRKYKRDHEVYLEAITAGRNQAVPKVYGDPATQIAPKATKIDSRGKSAQKKPAPGTTKKPKAGTKKKPVKKR